MPALEKAHGCQLPPSYLLPVGILHPQDKGDLWQLDPTHSPWHKYLSRVEARGSGGVGAETGHPDVCGKLLRNLNKAVMKLDFQPEGLVRQSVYDILTTLQSVHR